MIPEFCFHIKHQVWTDSSEVFQLTDIWGQVPISIPPVWDMLCPPTIHGVYSGILARGCQHHDSLQAL